MEDFGKLCFVILALVISSIIGGFVFMKLWEWFIVWAFHVQVLNLIQSIGVAFMLAYVTYKKKKDDEDFSIDIFTKQLIESVFHSAIILGIAWLITLFH